MLGFASAAQAGSTPQLSAANRSSLKWQTHRTVAKRAITDAQRTAENREANNSAPDKRAPARRRVASPAIWQASGTSARGDAAFDMRQNMVMQASGEDPSPLGDPFGDDPLDAAGDATTKTSQPYDSDPSRSSGSDPLQPSDEPLRLRTDSDPFPDENVPGPFVDTLPENQSVVPGLAPGDISCDSYKKECEDAIERLRTRDITKIILGVVVEGTDGNPPVEGKDYPCECKLGLNAKFKGRNWSPTTFTWKATGTCFRPLYFQDVQLERYGHSWNPVVQPFMSAAHFFISVPLLPYKMGLNPPNECVYTLGYYRPGSCAPYMIEPIPFSLRAITFEALGATAFGFWFWPPPTGP